MRRAKLDQLAPRAPVAARVQDVFFQQGEWAAANQPVVSLLPDDKVKIRFFVPEQDVARYHLGDTIHFSCDGCAAGLTARVIYISAQPEFTPPIIYSRSSRDRLVFLMEALPGEPEGAEPGPAGGCRAAGRSTMRMMRTVRMAPAVLLRHGPRRRGHPRLYRCVRRQVGMARLRGP